MTADITRPPKSSNWPSPYRGRMVHRPGGTAAAGAPTVSPAARRPARRTRRPDDRWPSRCSSSGAGAGPAAGHTPLVLSVTTASTGERLPDRTAPVHRLDTSPGCWGRGLHRRPLRGFGSSRSRCCSSARGARPGHVLNQPLRGRAGYRAVLRTVFALRVTTAVLFRVVFSPDRAAAEILGPFGLGELGAVWLSEPRYVLFSLFLVTRGSIRPVQMLYLPPPEHPEGADRGGDTDGAGRGRRSGT